MRALQEMRLQRRDRRERPGQANMAVQEAAGSGQLIFEAENVSVAFRRARDFRGTHHPHPARRAHRHRRPQRRRQEHAAEAVARRTGTHHRHRAAWHPAGSGVLRPAARPSSISMPRCRTTSMRAAISSWSTARTSTSPATCAISCSVRSSCARLRAHCPVVNAIACCWRGCSPSRPTCWCWTSPPTTWTSTPSNCCRNW